MYPTTQRDIDSICFRLLKMLS